MRKPVMSDSRCRIELISAASGSFDVPAVGACHAPAEQAAMKTIAHFMPFIPIPGTLPMPPIPLSYRASAFALQLKIIRAAEREKFPLGRKTALQVREFR